MTYNEAASGEQAGKQTNKKQLYRMVRGDIYCLISFYLNNVALAKPSNCDMPFMCLTNVCSSSIFNEVLILPLAFASFKNGLLLYKIKYIS